MTEATGTPSFASTARSRGAFGPWPVFVLIGLALYGLLYLWSETLVLDHGERNRFFMVATPPPATVDTVILGASHAMPLGYGDFNARLEAASGGSVMNLSIEGAGVLPNRLVLDYFLTRHKARQVVFVLDSFAFYSAQWNEERIDDALFARAPFDPQLVATLLRYNWTWDQVLPYVSGFTKINNQERFAVDRSDAELNKFTRTYRPVPQIDKQRMAYLFPSGREPGTFARYLKELDGLAELADAHGAALLLVKLPTPPRYRDALPDEAAFDAAIAELVSRHGLAYRDFSTLLPGDENYYDTDHLNATGVEALIANGFGSFLAGARSQL